MSTLKDLQLFRGKAQRKHRHSLTTLEAACAAADPSLRRLESLLNSLESEFDTMLETHVTLVLEGNQTVEEPMHAAWISLRQQEHDVVADLAKELLALRDEDGAEIAPMPSLDQLKDERVLQHLLLQT